MLNDNKLAIDIGRRLENLNGISHTTIVTASSYADAGSSARRKTALVGEQIQPLQSVAAQFPASASFRDKTAAGIALLFGLVDGEEFDPRLAGALGGGPREEFERQAVEVERDLVAGHAFPVGLRIRTDERRVAP